MDIVMIHIVYLTLKEYIYFVMYYNNILGRKEKKHIITRDRAYHGSTYLTGSITGKDRE